MKNIYLLGLVSLLLIWACQEKNESNDEGSSIGILYLSKSHPKPGDSLQIQYDIDSTKIEEPEAYYQYMVHNMIYPVDIELKKDNQVWASNLIIPDSATALAFNFNYGKEAEDNDKQGYLQPLYNEGDSLLASTQASIGYYYLTMGERNALKKDKKEALALMESDLLKNPDLASIWDKHYARLLLVNNPTKGEKLLAEKIKEYSKKENPSEDDYDTLFNLFASLGNETKIDSIRSIAVQKFPAGEMAQNQMASKFFNGKDINERMVIFKDYESSFGKNTRDYNYMLSTIASEFAKEEDWEGFSEYADKISEPSSKAMIYNNTAWKLAKEDKELELAAELSKKSLDIIKTPEKYLEERPPYFSEKQYIDNLKGNFVMFADTYAYVLFQQKKFKEALEFQTKAMGDKPRSAHMNERYVQFLMANKKFDKAEKEAALFVKENRANEKISQYLKEAYVINRGSKAGFEDYISDLEKVADKVALDDIKGKMINEEGYDFTLKNLKGEEVALADLKGKVVILDFWATWCGPCTDSFPGMQIAVNKYKDDPNVTFLFIDTLESGTSEEIEQKVGKLIAENKYTFNVVYDTPIKEGSRNYITTQAYGIRGIPTKIILGPEGNIRFKSVGYMGNNEQLVKELDIMIELAGKGTDYDFKQKT